MNASIFDICSAHVVRLHLTTKLSYTSQPNYAAVAKLFFTAHAQALRQLSKTLNMHSCPFCFCLPGY